MIQRVGWWMIAAALLGGCQPQRYRSMQMGSVDYDRAFLAAVDTMKSYFPILSADGDDGRIITAPRKVAGGLPVLPRARNRQWAEMRIRREGLIVWADIRVTVENRSELQRQAFGMILRPYQDTDPGPRSDLGDPYAREQVEEAWTPVGTNTDLEWQILRALYDRLHR